MKDGPGWGAVLWLFGYVLGILLFAVAPVKLIGWIIAPFGAALSLWVAFKKVKGDTLAYFGLVAIIWLLIAIAGDYVLIVLAFAPADGYYKLDVYVYYLLTFAIPLFAGWKRTSGVRRGP